MKKSILNLGKALTSSEQKEINGGALGPCYQQGAMCCRDTGSDWGPFCEPGACTRWGTCFYY
ncbi:hypothetical protein ACOSP6_09185 [Tenacibaculum sp. MEBiC06402]|uniref:hypothetical protein n=1 Tax=unclassified Tenacibaculum TaxID=2635139 RepID=UPI003B9C7C08